jgi:hypothetical protein
MLIETIENGDDHVSSDQRHIWNLIYHVLVGYGCPIMYRSTGPNATIKQDLCHEFFVPKHHKKVNEVIAYLKQELQDEVREGKSLAKDQYIFGVRVIIYYYSGIDTYIDREICIDMANKATKFLMEKIKKSTGGNAIH